MRLRSIDSFEESDEGPVPHTITVTMSIKEAAAIAALFGKMNGYATTKLGLDLSVYSCLAGDVFNRYWDNGWEDVCPANFTLATLNEAP